MNDTLFDRRIKELDALLTQNEWIDSMRVSFPKDSIHRIRVIPYHLRAFAYLNRYHPKVRDLYDRIPK